jgi:predicted oxidoreductase
MRIHEMEPADLTKLIGTATDLGINTFDHADIYGGGRSEEVFADAVNLTSSIRDAMVIQSKCGIRESYYDFSKNHILTSVENSLRRLRTDYLDILLLHRPDSLMEPEEVADAFDSLERAGKVRQFGVSNQNPMQIELLKSHVRQNLIVNQLQLSLAATGIVDSGLGVDAGTPNVSADGHVLEYCRINGVTIQAWSPFQLPGWAGTFLGNEKFPRLNAALERVAQKSGVSAATVAIAWILRHPANIQPIVGTTSTERITQIAKAADIVLTRQEWYELYRSGGKDLP